MTARAASRFSARKRRFILRYAASLPVQVGSASIAGTITAAACCTTCSTRAAMSAALSAKWYEIMRVLLSPAASRIRAKDVLAKPCSASTRTVASMISARHSSVVR